MPEWLSPFPDSEHIVISTIRHYIVLAGDNASVMGDVPRDWDDEMPVVIVQRTGGAASRQGPGAQHRIDMGIFSVMVFASKKKDASVLARKVSKYLHQAVLDRYEVAGTDGGIISKFQETKGPVHVFDGVTGKHPDAAMYDATYTLWLRGHYE